jgi:hypothetical protein
MWVQLSNDQISAVKGAVRGSIDLYRGYVTIRPETPVMKRKQARKRKELVELRGALKQLQKADQTP